MLARGAGITLVGRLAGRGLHVAGQIAVARVFGPEAFGLYAIGWTILTLGSLIAMLGLDSGVIRFGSMYRGDHPPTFRTVIHSSIAVAGLFGVLMGGALFLLAPWLARIVFDKPELTGVLRAFAPGFALAAGLRVAAAATRVSQQVRYSTYAMDVTQPGTNLLFLVLVFVTGASIVGAAVAGTVSFGLGLGLSVYFVARVFPQVFQRGRGYWRMSATMLAFSIPASMAGILANFTNRIDRLIVGYFRSADEVGVYQAVSQSAILFATITGAFNAILAPMIAAIFHQGESERLEELYRVSTKWGLYLSVPMFVTFVLAPAEVMRVVFGPRYVIGAMPLVILGVAQIFNAGTGAVGPLLIMSGRQKEWFLISGSMLVTNIGLGALLVPRYGIVGAALASSAAVGGLFSIGLFYVKRELHLWPYDRRYWKGGIAALVAVAGAAIIRSLVDGPPVLTVILVLLSGTLCFGGVLFALGLDQEDREMVRTVVSRIAAGRMKVRK